MIRKEWRVLDPPPPGFPDLLGLPPLQARLVYNRGIKTASDLGPYLAPDAGLLNDPMLLPDMDKAVARLKEALAGGERIGVFGDFDTDGITGTALATRALRDLGAPVVTYLPHRVDEGHGLNQEAIRSLRDDGVSLMVTVDCGADAVDEVRFARSVGVDTIVTDHHTLSAAVPDACALINPHSPDSAYPYRDLTGVGMSFKLVEALYADLGRPHPDHLLELVALGTIADVAPLTGENRYLVKRGLEILNATESPGIQALLAEARLRPGSLDTESLSFGIIPRLNAAGRLDDANVSLQLLTAPDATTATPLARELQGKNSERQLLTKEGVAEAEQQVEVEVRDTGVPPIIIVQSEEWIPGVLGLIAGRLSEAYYRPAIALSLGNEVSRASARSIPEFDIIAALRQSRDLFIRVGGHPRAAGFTVATPAIPALKGELKALAAERFKGLDLAPQIGIDCEISPRSLPGDNFKFIGSLSPFGEANPEPVFLTRNARVVAARQIGAGGDHLRMRLRHEGSVWDAIAFRQRGRLHEAQDAIDVVYTMGVDTWGHAPTLKLTVLDFRPTS